MEPISVFQSQDLRRIPLDGTILVAHQPQFLPWLGFFSKASMGDVYLIHDVDQFKKETFENRNRIRIKNDPGWIWLTAPVSGKSDILNIGEVRFNNSIWREKALKSIKLSYSRAEYFNDYYLFVEEIIRYPSESLREFNINAILKFFKLFEIKVPVYRSSELILNGFSLNGKSTEAVISMSKWFNAKIFVAGIMGKTYLDKEKFRNSGIQLVFQKFNHPVYYQLHGGFLPFMSVIDILFNHGPNAVNILGKSDFEK